MKARVQSKVEEFFRNVSLVKNVDKKFEKIPVITVDNYSILGQIAALRFLEWACSNPGGVVALPSGKTPEFFIKWTQHYLRNWNNEMKSGMLGNIGFNPRIKPNIKSLHFIQLDEFFPINPKHERSFNYFVQKYYIRGFGFDKKKARLIDSYSMTEERKKILWNIENLEEVFPGGVIDLSLRTKQPATNREKLQKKTIKMMDQFCEEYEDYIRSMGGIGFFLGGIGPDGHVAFNVKGSSHHSHTRLTKINYETQAAAAADLGGIESVRKKAVITIGLETITYNPDVVAIIIAAGEAKVKVISDTIEKDPSPEYPASCLHKLKNARFYLTNGAASKLKERNRKLLINTKKPIPEKTIEKLIIDGAVKESVFLMELANKTQKTNTNSVPEWQLARKLSSKTISNLAEQTYESLSEKIEQGLNLPKNQRFLHTAPHHDDIELAYYPLLHHLVRSKHNENHFCYCTSGFTSVTNDYILERMEHLLKLITNKKLFSQIPAGKLADPALAHEDITGYLNGIAHQDPETQSFHLSCRMVRDIFSQLKTKDTKRLTTFISTTIETIKKLDPGRVEPEILQLIKSWNREFEAELVWAHFGIDMEYVQHLRLQFYTGDIFPRYPDYKRDVLPIFKLLKKVRPTIITVALDPEGSGPDTHFKTLIALESAIAKYVKENKDVNLKIWGYRNVWSRFHPSEVNMIVPVSLNSFAVLQNMFNSCFLSQKSASFPSYEMEGNFSELAQKIWVEQYNKLTAILGKSFFYDNPNPMMRRSYGAIYIKDMSYEEFNEELIPVRSLLKAKKGLKEI